MEPLLITTIAIFSVATLVGGILLSFVLARKPTPKGVALMHGLVAAVGLALLVVYVASHAPGPIEALIAFIVAALGGGLMFARDMLGKGVPRWLAVGHGLIAVVGLGLLLGFALNGAL